MIHTSNVACAGNPDTSGTRPHAQQPPLATTACGATHVRCFDSHLPVDGCSCCPPCLPEAVLVQVLTEVVQQLSKPCQRNLRNVCVCVDSTEPTCTTQQSSKHARQLGGCIALNASLCRQACKEEKAQTVTTNPAQQPAKPTHTHTNTPAALPTPPLMTTSPLQQHWKAGHHSWP